ncbi:MAG TPA: VOC family protein [Pirellulales bacterium]|jgi:catechol 2,3-dioxygenase-like lactoylglutathione lyase family enzyme|nr:VOC family protein [Pirellulales bacterium]
MPKITGVLETSLYVADVNRAAHFYESLFGFHRMFTDDRLCALSVDEKQVLLIFQRGASVEPIPLAGDVLPPHDGTGSLHLAFACTAQELSHWEEHLAQHEVPIESRIRWERGGQSIYFRDPDDNLIELATPGIWPIY